MISEWQDSEFSSVLPGDHLVADIAIVRRGNNWETFGMKFPSRAAAKTHAEERRRWIAQAAAKDSI